MKTAGLQHRPREPIQRRRMFVWRFLYWILRTSGTFSEKYHVNPRFFKGLMVGKNNKKLIHLRFFFWFLNALHSRFAWSFFVVDCIDWEVNQSTELRNPKFVYKIVNRAHDLKGCKLFIFFHANPAGFSRSVWTLRGINSG